MPKHTTVIMKPFFGYLPDENKKDRFMGAFLKEIEKLDVGR